MYSDLSPYEVARLKNIQANKLKLAALGLLGSANPLKKRPENKKDKKVKNKRKVQKNVSAGRKKVRIGTRRSSRLAGIKLPDTKDNLIDKSNDNELFDGTEEEEPTVNYFTNPQIPQELDDHEFEIYTAVRKWRLERKNELQVEPYKICQNRTICELIRRRRNDKSWALPTSSTRPQELTSCWGIGPSKCSTFGIEMIEILDKWEETLGRSRKMSEENDSSPKA